MAETSKPDPLVPLLRRAILVRSGVSVNSFFGLYCGSPVHTVNRCPVSFSTILSLQATFAIKPPYAVSLAQHGPLTTTHYRHFGEMLSIVGQSRRIVIRPSSAAPRLTTLHPVTRRTFHSTQRRRRAYHSGSLQIDSQGHQDVPPLPSSAAATCECIALAEIPIPTNFYAQTPHPIPGITS